MKEVVGRSPSQLEAWGIGDCTCGFQWRDSNESSLYIWCLCFMFALSGC